MTNRTATGGRATPAGRKLKPAERSRIKVIRDAIALTRDPETDKPISDRRFAKQFLRIDERTLRSYLAGEHKVPGPVLAICEGIIQQSKAAPATPDVD